jgi:serine/threonine protein kinase
LQIVHNRALADRAFRAELEWEATWDDVQTEKEIGRGHYGVVYKAKWKGREVAVKQLKNPKPELAEEFLGEIEVMKCVIVHLHVLPLLRH